MSHWVRHMFGWYFGKVVSVYLNGWLWVGFQCDACHEINHLHQTNVQRMLSGGINE